MKQGGDTKKRLMGVSSAHIVDGIFFVGKTRFDFILNFQYIDWSQTYDLKFQSQSYVKGPTSVILFFTEPCFLNNRLNMNGLWVYLRNKDIGHKNSPLFLNNAAAHNRH
jgi:hypothetical protein